MPKAENIAAALDKRNKKINTVDAKAKPSTRKPKAEKRAITKNTIKADPGLTLKDRTKAAIRSRARRGKVGAADRALAKREGLDIADLF